MITKLKLENFKGIKKGEIELAPLTILLGPNNAGKTTILEALFLAPNPLRLTPYMMEKNMMGRRMLRALEVVREIHKTLKYEGFLFLLNYYISDHAEITCWSKNSTHRILFFRREMDLLVETDAKVSHITDAERRFYILAELPYSLLSPNGHNIYYDKPIIEDSIMFHPRLYKLGIWYIHYNWIPIVNAGTCRKVAKEVSHFSTEKYGDLTLEPFIRGEVELNMYTKERCRIRVGDIGDGIQSLVVYKILIEDRSPPIILWDDIESHFNPRILMHVADWFSDLVSQNGKQVIISTHSLEAAELLSSANDDARIILVKLEEGILKSRVISPDELRELRKLGVDIRMAEGMLL